MIWHWIGEKLSPNQIMNLLSYEYIQQLDISILGQVANAGIITLAILTIVKKYGNEVFSNLCRFSMVL